MRRITNAAFLVAALVLPPAALAQEKKGGEDVGLTSVVGAVEKVDKESLTVQPRGPGGKFQKGVALRLTGTSRVTVLTAQTRDGKVVLTQREAEAKDLKPGQSLAVIYAAAGKDGPVLLSAVAQPSSGK